MPAPKVHPDQPVPQQPIPVPAAAVGPLRYILEHMTANLDQVVPAPLVQAERRRFALEHLYPLLQHWTAQGMLNDGHASLVEHGLNWLAQRFDEDCDEDPNGAPAN